MASDSSWANISSYNSSPPIIIDCGEIDVSSSWCGNPHRSIDDKYFDAIMDLPQTAEICEDVLKVSIHPKNK